MYIFVRDVHIDKGSLRTARLVLSRSLFRISVFSSMSLRRPLYKAELLGRSVLKPLVRHLLISFRLAQSGKFWQI